MPVDASISVEEYLRTSYSPDRDYVDGEVQERNLGELDHSSTQREILFYLLTRYPNLRKRLLPEQRVQVRADRFTEAQYGIQRASKCRWPKFSIRFRNHHPDESLSRPQRPRMAGKRWCRWFIAATKPGTKTTRLRKTRNGQALCVRCPSCSSTKWTLTLTPAAFHKNVLAAAMLPPRSDPHSVRAWRRFPSACLPGVSITVPPVISADPDMLPAGTDAAMFHDSSRRRDFYDYFGLHGADAEAKP
jgi:hypothetical protein